MVVEPMVVMGSQLVEMLCDLMDLVALGKVSVTQVWVKVEQAELAAMVVVAAVEIAMYHGLE